MEMKIIARIRTDFPSKFGVPRQSGLVPGLTGRIVFEKEYSPPEAFRGLDGFSHIWIVWGFSETDNQWSPTVRPPRLGGNKRVGVFASRSPFRPNSIGLSAVKLDGVDMCDGRAVLRVSGIDMTDGTPIYDIKPYLTVSDRIDAHSGYSDETLAAVSVVAPSGILSRLPEDKRDVLLRVLESDPRPQYHTDRRTYGFTFAGYEIKFESDGNTLTVTDIIKT